MNNGKELDQSESLILGDDFYKDLLGDSFIKPEEEEVPVRKESPLKRRICLSLINSPKEETHTSNSSQLENDIDYFKLLTFKTSQLTGNNNNVSEDAQKQTQGHACKKEGSEEIQLTESPDSPVIKRSKLDCDKDNIANDTIEFRMSQLFKSDHYRKEVSQLFEDVESSICNLGVNQDETLVPESALRHSKLDLADDTLDFLTLNSEQAGIGYVIKKALMDNAAGGIEQEREVLINKTLINRNVTVFRELGPFYSLPMKVKELIKTYKGIEELYDWQDECLKLPAVKDRKNLVYALPTSGGKTLVAEILILRELICRKRNALFVLPFVAIVQEKVWAMSPFGVALDFLIEEYAAEKGAYPPRKRRYKNSVYIATIEKALGLVNSLIEVGRLDELGLVVIDELHLIGESRRGSTLEALLTKLMYLNDHIQIIGMSATIGNIKEICTFLKAEVYSRNFRPVELTEYVKCGDEVARIDLRGAKTFQVVRKTTFRYSKTLIKIDPDRLGGLVMEVVPEGSCLIFCPSKQSCENVTRLLCQVMFPSIKDQNKDEKEILKRALKNESGTLCPILKTSIDFGVAYHHSGLTSEERRLVEDAFRNGTLRVICCTSTLAAGVNLPAKRVIIRKPYIGQDFITLSRYKQMIGRAGRAGLGEVGESILICTPEELAKVKELLLSPMDEALSDLHNYEGLGLSHLFLSCISLGIATTRNQLLQVANTTLLAVQQEKLQVNVKTVSDKAISSLFKLGALQTPEQDISTNVSVRFNTSVSSLLSEAGGTSQKTRITINGEAKLVISRLGCAAIKGGLELSKAHDLHDDLTEAQWNVVLVDCLHLLYLVTPYDASEQIKPQKILYYNILINLGTKEAKTAKILGIDEACAQKLFTNLPIKKVPERVLNRFYVSLMLFDLWNGASIISVSEKFAVNRGVVQNLMTTAASFAANVVSFCEQLTEFWAFADLLKGMSQRLSHCCVKELVPLMELPAVKQGRAKQLYNAGFKNLQAIAKADPNELVEKIEFLSKRVANQLIAAAKLLLLEKVETLREQADDIFEGIDGTNDLTTMF